MSITSASLDTDTVLDEGSPLDARLVEHWWSLFSLRALYRQLRRAIVECHDWRLIRLTEDAHRELDQELEQLEDRLPRAAVPDGKICSPAESAFRRTTSLLVLARYRERQLCLQLGETIRQAESLGDYAKVAWLCRLLWEVEDRYHRLDRAAAHSLAPAAPIPEREPMELVGALACV